MKKPMPKGFRSSETSWKPRVAVTFDEALFQKICAMATKDDKSFSEMVCVLCRVGALDLEESDRLEPAA